MKIRMEPIKRIFLIFIFLFPWFLHFSDNRNYYLSGDKLAERMIEESDHGRKVLNFDSPESPFAKTCFVAFGYPVDSQTMKLFGVPIVFSESDDSNLWHAIMPAPDRTGAIALGINHSVLAWDVGKNETQRIHCPSRVRISFSDDGSTPTFHPDVN